MPTPDDEQFERYLKQFQPLVPEPLPARAPGPRIRRMVVLWASGVVAVGILIGMLVARVHTRQNREPETNIPGPSNGFRDVQPLTIRNANALMAKAQSLKALMDQMAFRPPTIPLPKGKQSAVAVLGKEKLKL